ncbi:hypothetical protein LB554_18005 [Mesorhizobium sp. CO1-1-11]|nr:hypothetical protein [Mesorhizobium sp. CO1-1-11]
MNCSRMQVYRILAEHGAPTTAISQ